MHTLAPITRKVFTARMLVICACAIMLLSAWLGGDHPGVRWKLAFLACVFVPLALAVESFNYGDSQTEFAKAVRRAIDSFRHGDGSIDLAKSGSPLDSIASEITATLSEASREVSDLAHARSAADLRLRRVIAERDRLREVLDALPFPIAEVDSNETLALANTAAREVLSIDANAVGKPCREAIPVPTMAQLLLETRKRAAGTVKSLEWSTGQGDEAREWKASAKSIPYSHVPAVHDGRQPAAAVVSMVDNSALKLIQKRNAEFVSAASHEMKAPLSSILAYAELLADEDCAEESRDEYIGVITSQADRLHRLVLNLLNIARIEAGVVKVNKVELSLNDVLRGAFGSIKPNAEAKRITLVDELSSMYLAVYGDRDTLMQAAINLLSNAVKYTPDGGKVTLRSRLDDGTVSFEVVDTGMGLSPEDRMKVFERFYRVQKNAEMAPGTGLGLPLVKHIVEDVHSGRIEVESELGVGSTFRIVLPRVTRG